METNTATAGASRKALGTPPATMPRNFIVHGDCTEVMRDIPTRSVNLVLTDPPYICRYRARWPHRHQ